jgi:hypothetical protein
LLTNSFRQFGAFLQICGLICSAKKLELIPDSHFIWKHSNSLGHDAVAMDGTEDIGSAVARLARKTKDTGKANRLESVWSVLSEGCSFRDQNRIFAETEYSVLSHFRAAGPRR